MELGQQQYAGGYQAMKQTRSVSPAISMAQRSSFGLPHAVDAERQASVTPLSEVSVGVGGGTADSLRQQVISQSELIKALYEKVTVLEGRLDTPSAPPASMRRQQQPLTMVTAPTLPPIVQSLTDLINDTLAPPSAGQRTPSGAPHTPTAAATARTIYQQQQYQNLNTQLSKLLANDTEPASWDSLERDVSAWKAKIHDLSTILDTMAGGSGAGVGTGNVSQNHMLNQGQAQQGMATQGRFSSYYTNGGYASGFNTSQAPVNPAATSLAVSSIHSNLSFDDPGMLKGQQASPVTSPTPRNQLARDLGVPSQAREKLQEHAEKLTELLTPEEPSWIPSALPSTPSKAPPSPTPLAQQGNPSSQSYSPRKQVYARPSQHPVTPSNPRRPRKEQLSAKGSPRLVSPPSGRGSPHSGRGSPSPSKGPSYRLLAKGGGYPQRDHIIKQVHDRLSYLSRQIGNEEYPDQPGPKARSASPQSSPRQQPGVVPVSEYASEQQLKRVQRFRERRSKGM